jgi:hypothetical protein
MFHLSTDELRGTAGTSPFDVDLIQKGYPLFGFEKETHLRLLAEYVPKLYPKSQIKKWLQSNPDKTFLQMIHPSDIAFTILLIKNGEAQWIDEYKNKGNTGPKVKGLFNSDTQKKRTFGEVMWSAEGMDYFKKCKTNWDRTYADLERWEKLQADWCEYIKDKKSPLLHMALINKKKAPSVDVQQEMESGAPNMFLFPGDDGYEGDEYERLRRESGASNQTGLLNMLGVNEINEDLQKMSEAQLGDDYNEEGNENYELEEEKEEEVEEEKEEGTDAAEVDDEMVEENNQNKKNNKKRKATVQPPKRLPTTRGRKVGV